MRRKMVSVLLTGAMLATVLAGCGSKPQDSGNADAGTDTPAPADTTQADTPDDAGDDADAGAESAGGEAVTLKWAIWDKDTTPYWNALKEAYEASHDGVTIEMTDLGSADYQTVLATELSGSGSDFDVVTIKDVPG